MIVKKDYLSYSRLTGFDRDGFMFFNKEKKDSVALNLGSLVDDMLTSNKPIKDSYFVFTAKKPTSSLLKLFNEIKDNETICFMMEGIVYIDKRGVREKIKELGLWSKVVKDDVLNDKWNTTDFSLYMKEYLMSDGKVIVSEDDFKLAENMVSYLKLDNHTGRFFNKVKDVDIILQQEIYWMYGDQKYRSFIDAIRVDHIKKEIEFGDLKTTEERYDKMSKSWYMFRYDIQYSMYTEAMMQWTEKNYPGYSLMPMVYIVSSKRKPELPVIYEINYNWVNASKHGYRSGRYYKGWIQLTREINWHYEHNVYDKPKTLAENGSLFLEFYGDIDYD